MTDQNTFSFRKMSLAELREQYLNEVLLRFVHVGDTHISPDDGYNGYDGPFPPNAGARALVAAVNALPFQPDFILHTGDVAYDPDEAAYAKAKEILSEFKAPAYYLPGNHDDDAALQRIMLNQTPMQPFDYEFEARGVQVICLDSNSGTNPRERKSPAGTISDEQIAWLRARTEREDERPLLVAIHHNVLPIGSHFWDTFMRLREGERLHEALLPARARLRGVFSGHVHMATDLYKDGILYSTVNSSWYQLHCYPGQERVEEDRSTPPGFSVITLTRTQTFIRRHYFGVTGEKQ